MQNFIFTSTSVTEGHPDKLCDRISDTLVDQALARDARARILAECAIAPGAVFLSTYATGEPPPDIAATVRQVLAGAGYGNEDFSPGRAAVMTSFGKLSNAATGDTNMSDTEDFGRIPASNNVTLFGYACRQTPNLMPLPIVLAHALVARLDAGRRDGSLAFAHPDGQAQVAVEFRARRPVRIAGVTVIAAPVSKQEISPEELRTRILENAVVPTLQAEAGLPFNVSGISVNPQGDFLMGGPSRHAGLTGRKTGADAYGEFSRHAGTALSGKDPWRVERTGSYAARHAAKTLVAAGLAEECEVQLSYSIGQADPTSIEIDTFGSGNHEDRVLSSALRRVFDFRPAALVQSYGLSRLPAERPEGFFAPLASYGQMGREDLGAPWETLERVEALRDAL